VVQQLVGELVGQHSELLRRRQVLHDLNPAVGGRASVVVQNGIQVVECRFRITDDGVF
jgi:hypothetical protein